MENSDYHQKLMRDFVDLRVEKRLTLPKRYGILEVEKKENEK